MCLLHFGHDPVRHGSAVPDSPSERRANHLRNGWQPLSMRHLPTNYGSDPASCRCQGKTMMSQDDRELALEQAQHDSVPRLSYGFELGRREFFKVIGGGLVVC